MKLYLGLRQAYRRIGHVHSYVRNITYRRSTGFFGFEREDYPGIYDWGAMGYRGEPGYPGKVTFLWSITQPFRRGWRTLELANQVEVQVMPCSHTTCFTEYLEQLAKRLRDCVLGVEAAIEGDQEADSHT